MSLDIDLVAVISEQDCTCTCGHKHKATSNKKEVVFTDNITHNLTHMARAAGLYKALWRPDEINISKAFQLVEPLKAGLSLLKETPAKFKKFNPDNNWGSYEGLVTFVQKLLRACEENPEATVEVSR